MPRWFNPLLLTLAIVIGTVFVGSVLLFFFQIRGVDEAARRTYAALEQRTPLAKLPLASEHILMVRLSEKPADLESTCLFFYAPRDSDVVQVKSPRSKGKEIDRELSRNQVMGYLAQQLPDYPQCRQVVISFSSGLAPYHGDLKVALGEDGKIVAFDRPRLKD